MTADTKHLPTYSFKEEVMNSISHLVGLVFAFGTLIFFISFAVKNNIGFLTMFPFYLYSLVMMMVFFVSSFYHSSRFGSKKRAVARIIDHCDIYAFVAATYFPICVYGIANQGVSIAVMVIEVTLALLGITLNLIPNNSKVIDLISYLIYIIDGWILIAFYPFGIGLDFNVFIFVLLGGVIYSLGAIIYAIGSKKEWFHSVFHVFVVLAAITQFIGILFLLF